jgi:hypothetical protein
MEGAKKKTLPEFSTEGEERTFRATADFNEVYRLGAGKARQAGRSETIAVRPWTLSQA